MNARRPLAADLLLELTVTVNAVARALPRRERSLRYRLEYAVQQLVVSAGAGHLVMERPTRQVAYDQLAAAIRVARAAGVSWPDVVVLVNGDDER